MAAGGLSRAALDLALAAVDERALQAPYRAPDSLLGERIGVHVPFGLAAVTVLVGAGVLAASRGHLAGVDAEEGELDEITDDAIALTFGSES